MTDRLRMAMQDLAEQVEIVDLAARALRTSRRRRMRRIVTASAAAATALVLISGVAYAVGGKRTTQPAPRPADTASVSRSPSAAPTEPGPAPSSPDTATGSTKPGSPSASPRGDTAIPASAMLQGSDIGPNYRSRPIEGDDHGILAMIFSYCGATFPQPGSTELASRSTFISRDAQHAVLQRTARYRPGEAGQAVQHVRTMLTGQCAVISNGGNPGDQSRFLIEAVDIAGNSALLIREDRSNDAGTTRSYRIVIEQYDMFTEIRTTGGMEEFDVYGMARSASQRMCEATPTLC
jgi:hypothetical protein